MYFPLVCKHELGDARDILVHTYGGINRIHWTYPLTSSKYFVLCCCFVDSHVSIPTRSSLWSHKRRALGRYTQKAHKVKGGRKYVRRPIIYYSHHLSLRIYISLWFVSTSRVTPEAYMHIYGISYSLNMSASSTKYLVVSDTSSYFFLSGYHAHRTYVLFRHETLRTSVYILSLSAF